MRVKILLTFLFLIRTGSSENNRLPDNINEIIQGEDANYTAELKEFEKEFAKQFQLKKYIEIDIKKLNKLINSLQINDTEAKSIFILDHTICNLCNFAITNLQTRRITVEVIGRVICDIYISLTTLTINNFCKDIIELNKPILEYIVDNSAIFNPTYACSILLQNKECYYKSSPLTWRITIPSGPRKIPQIAGQSNPPLKVLHLTDVHITFDYEVNGISDCGYPVCCKRGLGNPIKGQNAGYWGDYNCDIPRWLYLNALQEISNRHKDIDFIYFTGDIIDHTVWKGAKKDHIEMMRYTFEMLENYFPNKTVLPVIGNHEALPLNVFAPPHITNDTFSQKWLYELMANLWNKWLPKDTLQNVLKQGYYSYYIHKNLKVIALNNNICYIYNWWILYNTTFLNEQLSFLRTELKEAEDRGHFVHIISHVFPGNKECIEPWEKNYNNLISRYSHIIKGQFFGHTHTDELKVFYDDDKKPINVGYNGASLTTFVKYNPNYKILKLDPNTYDVLDIDTYIFNLTEANLNPEKSPEWFKLYSMKEAYEFDKLSPENFDNLANKMSSNSSLFNQYWRYYTREGDASLKDGCDDDCKKDLICKITTTESLEPTRTECHN